MLDFIPLVDKRGKVLNQFYCHQGIVVRKSELLRNYPRIKNAFTIAGDHDIDIAYNDEYANITKRSFQRKNIIDEIYQNIKRFEF